MKYGQKVAHLLVYVDDILVVGEDIETVTSAKKCISELFSAKDQGDAHYILGMEISRDAKRNLIQLRQKALITKYSDELGISNKRKVSTPLPNQWRPVPNVEVADPDRVKRFQKGIGELLYISRCTRPDISAAVNILSRFTSNPSSDHEEKLERIFIYLNCTRDLYLKLGGKKSDSLNVFVDADWGENKVNRKSTTGYVLMLGKGPIAWRSQTQKTVAISTMEAEYTALSECLRELIWAKEMINHFGMKPETRIFCDNQSTIASFKNPTNVERLKHVDIRFHFIIDTARRMGLEIEYIASENNMADMLTKPLEKGKFHNHRQKIGNTLWAMEIPEKGSVEISEIYPTIRNGDFQGINSS